MSSEMREKNIQKIQVLDNLIENENKSKRLTAFIIIGFCILGIAIVYLGSQLTEKEAELKITLAEVKLLVKERDQHINRADSVLEILESEKKRLNRNIAISDSIHLVSSDLINELQDNYSLLNSMYTKTVAQLDKSKISTAPPKIDEATSEKLKAIEQYKNQYKCYVQYMPKFEGEAKKVVGILKQNYSNKNYMVSAEKIDDQSFNSYIKYFDRYNEKTVYELYNILLNAGIRMSREPLFVDLPKSSKNVEIWLGQQLKRDVKDILLDPKYKQNIYRK